MMRKVTYVLWTGFFICMIVFAYHAVQFVHSGTHYNIACIQLAPLNKIDLILEEWNRFHLLPIVVYNTTIDFFFIIFYVFLLVVYSHRRARLEKNKVLRSILMANAWVAVLAGIFDGIENNITLQNIRHFTIADYESSRYVSIIKFVLIGWVIVCWLISKLSSGRQPSHKLA